jgi:hypothetical protein
MCLALSAAGLQEILSTLKANFSVIATESDEMELAGLLKALQSPGHGINLSRSATEFIAYRKIPALAELGTGHPE